MLTPVISHATGDVFPASDWNTYIRDNLNWLVQAGANLIVVANALTVTNEFHQVNGGGTINSITYSGAINGQRIRLLCNASTSFANGAGNILTISGGTRVSAVGEIVEFAFDGTNWREAQAQPGMAMVYDNLLAAPATTVSTGTLPAIYKHLLIVIRSRTDSATAYPTSDILRMRINGDTGSNYDSVDGGGGAGTGEASMRVGNSTMGTSGAGLFASNLILIPDYASASNRKVVMGFPAAGFSTNNSATAPIGVFNAQGSWRTNNTPITSLAFLTGPTVGTTNLVAGCRITVYGLM